MQLLGFSLSVPIDIESLRGAGLRECNALHPASAQVKALITRPIAHDLTDNAAKRKGEEDKEGRRRRVLVCCPLEESNRDTRC